ncbi:unnamed protein product [Brassicogethes aeneus]|uniref:DNA polymerase eta n=1 Tax=Brassicogethes aeneus TaxID=1431903 RepID=A0A9P0FJ54_BRAAE|nr:unnamed protein product [Brassicogethes aeneus]
MSHTERVVILVDMDCFYCQVEEKLDPRLESLPIAVVQYNAWRGGGIIAVNYPARDKGVTRHMRGEDARAVCPEIQLVKVPNVRGKADLTKYREAGKRVAEVLQAFTPLLQRASVDEAYLDITKLVKKRIEEDPEQISKDKMKNTHIVGFKTEDFLINSYKDKIYNDKNFNLAMGGLIAEEIRAAVLEKTGYKCSAGIAHNKILAKLVAGLHKPNQQTIIPQDSIPQLYETLSIKKIKNLGGKFGNMLSEKLNIENMGQLSQFSHKDLSKHFDEKTTNWLYNIARGIDSEPVTTRLVPKSIGCCKRFPGKNCLILPEDVDHWIGELAQEIAERLEQDFEENNRRAKQIIVSFTQKINFKDVTSSRTQSLTSYDFKKVKQIGMDVLNRHCLKSDGNYHILFLGLNVGNFEDNKNVSKITSFFKNGTENVKNPEIVDSKVTKIFFKAFQGPSCSTKEQIQEDIITNEETEKADNKEDNVSIYSVSTVDLEEDIDNFIYYDDVFCKKDDLNKSENPSPRKDRPGSFFKRYFHKPEERNFDTSKIFEEESSEEENYENNITEPEENNGFKHFQFCAECNKKIPDNEYQSHIDFHFAVKVSDDKVSENTQNNTVQKCSIQNMLKNVNSHNELIDLSNVEKCPDCNKLIPLSEVQSHKDYHFALKLVKEESHIYKTKPSILNTEKYTTATKTKNKKVEKSNKNLKRKVSEIKSNISLKSFFKTEDLNNDNSTICSTCCKRIKLEDFGSHVDFHEARKLHNQLNSTPTTPSKKVEKPNTSKGIVSYFKP